MKDDDLNFTSSQIGSYISSNISKATDEAVKGSDLIRKTAENLKNVPIDKKQGNLFEYIESTKFNIDAATKGEKIRAHITAAEGRVHDAADIEIKDASNKVLEKVQAKSYKNSAVVLRKLSNPKYKKMQKLVHPEQEQKIKRLAKKAIERNNENIYKNDYIDTEKNVSGKLKYKNISSDGTSYDETIKASEKTHLYTFKLETKQYVKEMGVKSVESAAAGAIMSGLFSTIKNGIECKNGEIGSEEAIKNIATDTGTSAIKSGATGALGTGIRISAEKLGIELLSDTNIATAISSSIIQMESSICSYAKGEINSEQLIENLGENGTSTISSIFVGASAGMIFGPGGALIGSLVGYILSSNVYKSCLSILKESEMKKEQYRKIKALLEKSSEELIKRRREFEKAFNDKYLKNKDVFDKSIALIENGLNQDSDEDVIYGLTKLTQYFGKELKLQKFEDFDEFMMNSDDSLIL